jgi:hypothetical protein
MVKKQRLGAAQLLIPWRLWRNMTLRCRVPFT